MSRIFGSLPVSIDRFLTPVDPEDPAGESLRYEGTYDKVKDARYADDPNLPRGIYERELETSDWEAVEELCTEALEERTKDLRLAAWLMEAWIHNHGFAGASGGIDLLTGLADTFWDDLYPQMREGDPEARLVLVEWIDNKLPPALRSVNITAPNMSGTSDQYTLLDWERTQRMDTDDDEHPTRNEILTSATLTPTAAYRELVEGLEQTMDASNAFLDLLEERCETTEVPPLHNWMDTLKAVKDFGQQVLADRETIDDDSSEETDDASGDKQVPSDSADAPSDATTEEPPSSSAEPTRLPAPPTVESVVIRSRADAYRLLWKASEYLLQKEPHSPTPYLVKRAVSWGNMSLDELLQELVNSGDDLAAIYELLGMTGDDEDARGS